MERMKGELKLKKLIVRKKTGVCGTPAWQGFSGNLFRSISAADLTAWTLSPNALLFGVSGMFTYAEEETHSQLYTVFNQILMFHVTLWSLLLKVFCPHFFALWPVERYESRTLAPYGAFPGRRNGAAGLTGPALLCSNNTKFQPWDT